VGEALLVHPTRFLDNDEAKRNVFAFSYVIETASAKTWPGRNDGDSGKHSEGLRHSLPKGSVCGPHNTDEMGRPQIMPTRAPYSQLPIPERDCLIVVSKRT